MLPFTTYMNYVTNSLIWHAAAGVHSYSMCPPGNKTVVWLAKLPGTQAVAIELKSLARSYKGSTTLAMYANNANRLLSRDRIM